MRGYLLSLVLGRRGLPGVRRACAVAMALLAIQFCVGTIVSLYVAIPASDSTVSYVREVETAPVGLTAHALVGLALLATGAVLVIRAAGTGHRAITGLSLAGLLALLGAFATGEAFVRDGENSASLAMALLAGLALLCYVAVQAMAVAGRPAGRPAGTPGGVTARPHQPALPAPRKPTAVDPAQRHRWIHSSH